MCNIKLEFHIREYIRAVLPGFYRGKGGGIAAGKNMFNFSNSLAKVIALTKEESISFITEE